MPIQNKPINIYALTVDGFYQKSHGSVYKEKINTIASYVKYMGYTHVLLLDGYISDAAQPSKEKRRAAIDALHLQGINVILTVLQKDVTDRDLYVYTLTEQIKSLQIDGLFFDIPLPAYSDRSLLKAVNKEIHKKFPNFITILKNKPVSDLRSCGFDLVLDLELYGCACDYLSYDPYFRRHIQSRLTSSLFDKDDSSRLIPRSNFESAPSTRSFLSSSFGTHEDKLMQKRSMDLAFAMMGAPMISMMGDEFSGASAEDGRAIVDWDLLDNREYGSLRSFTRALNFLYLNSESIDSASKNASLSSYDIDEEKNVLSIVRSYDRNKTAALVNLSGIEQNVLIQESGDAECIFATKEHVGNDSILRINDQKNTFLVKLPAFCGAVYRFK